KDNKGPNIYFVDNHGNLRNVADFDDPTDQIVEVNIKFENCSRSVIVWHKKCNEQESIFVGLQQKLYKALYKSAKYKCQIHSPKHKYDALVLNEEEDVRPTSITLWGYDWDFILSSHVEDIVGNSDDYKEYEYVKVTQTSH
ncbi:hypothetical protein DVH24_039272, partial [Malus domestica]